MKKLLLILLCFPMIGFSQSYCSLLNVTDIDIDSLNMTINIAVYDGNGTSPYPHAAYSIDAIGDTIHHGYLWLFGNNGFDTTWYLYPINSFPIYPLSIYYVYGMNADTCVLSFNNNSPQTYGCTDVFACNYDSTATMDDSTCVYSVIWQQNFSLCYGDSVMLGTSVYDTTGNYIDTLSVLNGCDSIIYTNISIASTTIWYQTYLICDGDSIVVGNNIYDTAGVYMDTLSSPNGCDSIVHTYLMVGQNTSSYDTLSVAASIVWNGTQINVSGDYSVTLINSGGCDSIANLNLTITIPSGILNITNTERTLVKITDMLGQETPYRKNTPLFYIYDDGTVEKKIIILRSIF